LGEVGDRPLDDLREPGYRAGMSVILEVQIVPSDLQLVSRAQQPLICDQRLVTCYLQLLTYLRPSFRVVDVLKVELVKVYLRALEVLSGNDLVKT
jgi:hypothetical protein